MHKNTIFKYEIENRNKAPKYTKLIWPLSQELKLLKSFYTLFKCVGKIQ